MKMDVQEVECECMDWIDVALGQGQVAGICKRGDEPSGSIKSGEFVDYLRTSQLLKKDCAAWSQ